MALLSLPSSSMLDFSSIAVGKLKRRAAGLINFGLIRSSSRSRTSVIRVAITMCVFASSSNKKVWIWTENQQVMTAAVERGWTTFLFSSHRRQLADDWSSIALFCPFFVEEGAVLDGENNKIARISYISSPQHLEKLQPSDELPENIIIDLLDWQVIPAENIVAAVQGTHKTVLAISKTSAEAQTFLEALELGLGGVVLKVEDVNAVFELKDYFDRRRDIGSLLDLTKATITSVQVTGMGDRVCVDLCSLMQPGEGLLGPVHAYVAVPGGKTSYLSELKAGKEVIVVDQSGKLRTAIVGRVKIETRQLVIVKAKVDINDGAFYNILLQNAEMVALISPQQGVGNQKAAIPVTSLKVGDEVLLRIQGGARHTGIEIQEFIVEK